jgi:CRISPR-associated protein Csh1
MIKEIINFTNNLDPELKAIGMSPKEGLHILLTLEQKDNCYSISSKIKYSIFSKKEKEISAINKKFALLANLAWMVNTNKCFDLPSKGIHSCSPYCLAFKRESIRGGAKFNDAKIKLYERISPYFDKSIDLLDDESEKEIAKVFKFALNDEQKINFYLDQIPEYSQLKDTEYIIFYLDLDEVKYKLANDKYLGGKLFNTEEYNDIGYDNQVYGTSNYLNGFNSKKPYLKHQSATFDITGRVSASEAKTLFEFESIIGRRILPNPLPIFVYNDELKASIELFKTDALEGGNKKGHQEIIEALTKKLNKDTIGNYYLMYYQLGEVKDFDFVSLFEYRLLGTNGKNFKVFDIFTEGKSYTIENVFEFQNRILPIIFNNSLVVKTKGDGPSLLKYFDELEQKYCDDSNTTIYNLIMTYRAAFYDYIYKSKRKAVNESMMTTIIMAGIYSDLKKLHNADDTQQRNRASNIKAKLNILFSFRQFNNQSDMSSIIPALTEKTRQVINDTEVHFETNEEFAFGVGQLIYFLLDQSESNNKSHALLEPFILKIDVNSMKDSIRGLLKKYAYKLPLRHGRLDKLMAEVQGFNFEGNFKELHEFMFTGYFSKCLIYEKSQKENNLENQNQ